MKLKVDAEFRDFIPALSPAERTALEAAIVKKGRATDPILTWKGTIVDGHNRYAICTKHGLPFSTEAIAFPNRAAVLAWMFTHQIARRNLSTDQIAVLAAVRGVDAPHITTADKERAAAVVAAGKQEWVLTGGLGLGSAYTRLQPPKPRAPRVTGGTPAAEVAPRDPVDTTHARVAAKAHTLSGDVKALQRRIIELEDAADFRKQVATINPKIIAPKSRRKSGLRTAVPTILASDWHFGEVVTAAETLGRNVYDLAIAHTRAQKFWENVLWLRADMARTQSCDDTVLFVNGDMISGSIHPELIETNIPLVHQVAECRAALKPGIIALAEATPGTLHIVYLSGNHGRLTLKSQMKTGWANSLEYILYQSLIEQLSHVGNIAHHIPPSEGFVIDVLGRRIQAQHGTHIKSQGGVGGVLVPLNKYCQRANSAEYYVFGHFHQAECFGRAVVNGSLIGDSAYSKWLGLEYRDPEQVMFAIDAERGLRRFERVSVT